ncbi:MAG: alpha/beta hydrolase [Phenylobacterium sp.]
MSNMTRRGLSLIALAAALAPVAVVAQEKPMAIDEGLFVDINGMPQWVTLRGADLANPVMLLLHGGPGFPMSSWAPVFADWEKRFTLVQWDQPAGGATFAKNQGRDQGPLTLERFVKDGFAVVDYIRSRLGARKIVLMGVSWGAELGVVMAHQRPELFSCYVGLSQPISAPRGALIGYQMALKAAQDRGDAKAVAELTRVGPPPYKTFEDFLVRQQYTNPPGLPPSPAEMAVGGDFIRAITSPPPPGANYVPKGVAPADFMKVFMDTQRAVYAPMAQWDIASLGREFALPIVLIEGELDLNTPTALARAWLDQIHAPAKVFEVIAGASHGPLAFHAEILRLLERDVLPLARQS